ncbi:S-adenosyl-L-methionine-dependent methyltransferase [Schizophyllum fasciatum]
MATQSSPLRALADQISQAVTVIESAFSAAAQPFPSLSAPYDPTSPAEAPFGLPEVAQAVNTISLACSALTASVETPGQKIGQTSLGFTATAAFEVALNGYVAEILRSHPSGLHVKEIAARNGVDAGKLGRILRYLASIHVFSELSPNVFANNRLSSALDTGNRVEDIQANPVAHFAGRAGLAGLVHHSCDVTFKGAAALQEILLKKEYASDDTPEKAAVPYAFKTSLPMYVWFEEPGNETRLAAFAAGMRARELTQVPDAIMQGFDFSTLPAGATVVDVGAGTGHFSLAIAKRYPDLQFVVEDRPAVVEKAKELWQGKLPNASVKMVGQDFFEPQAIKEPGVFLLGNILHNWGRTHALTILKNLRDAAGPATKLIIGEQIAPYACAEPVSTGNGIRGADRLLRPTLSVMAPGRATWPAMLDMVMLCNFNGEERTLGGFIELAEATGWKIVQVTPIPGILDSYLVAEPM